MTDKELRDIAHRGSNRYPNISDEELKAMIAALPMQPSRGLTFLRIGLIGIVVSVCFILLHILVPLDVVLGYVQQLSTPIHTLLLAGVAGIGLLIGNKIGNWVFAG